MESTALENPNTHRLCVGGLWIAGTPRTRSTVWMLCCAFLAFVLLVPLFFAFKTPPPSETQSVKVIEPSAARRVHRTPPPVMDVSESYYRTIIENNLFRPLGWRPPRPKEPYRLFGTVLPTDDRTSPTAILQTTAGNQTYIVMTGEPLDASTEVVEIKPKQVTLETDGQRRTLKLTATHYLNPVRVSRRVATQRHPAVRPPQGVRRTLPRAPRAALSDWQTREGEIIRIGDARLKNPFKWELQRRSRVK